MYLACSASLYEKHIHPAAVCPTHIHPPPLQVAALGLEPHKHLGKSIRQLQPHLLRLRDRFGCNVCGEGGEYETLTLDCPAFTHGRIVLDDWEVRGGLSVSRGLTVLGVLSWCIRPPVNCVRMS